MTHGHLMLDSDIAEIVAGLPNEVHDLAGAKVLLAGGGGFLGRYFLKIFKMLNEDVLAKPCALTILDNFKVADPTLLDQIGAVGTLVTADVSHDPLPDEDFDYVIQAAGIASPYYYRAYPLETLEVATVGTKRLLDLAKKSGARFTFFSSSEIYGDPDPKHVPTSESYRGNVASLGPRACYDEGKRLGETYCYVFHDHFGLHTNIIRPFNVYGPGMQMTDYRVMPNFAAQVADGKPLTVYGDGHQTRTFCYIADAMIGFMRVILKGVPGEVYNIGNPKPEVTMMTLAETFVDRADRDIGINVIEYPDSYPADEPMRRCPDIRKAALQLDYTPAVGLDEGVGRFLTWALPHYRAQLDDA